MGNKLTAFQLATGSPTADSIKSYKVDEKNIRLVRQLIARYTIKLAKNHHFSTTVSLKVNRIGFLLIS